MRDLGGLTDAFLATHPTLSPTAYALNNDGPPDPQQSIDELGVTCDSPLNTWTAGKPLDGRAAKGAGKRLDYIYFTGPNTPTSAADDSTTLGQFDIKSCQVTFTDRIPSTGTSYTDHFGLEAIFSIKPELDSKRTSQHLQRTAKTLEGCIEALTIGKRLPPKTQQLQLTGFFVLLFLAIGLVIGSGFQPVQGVNVVFTFFAVVAGFGATTLLYSGLIWGEWEQSEFSLQANVGQRVH